jgi:hypothetical protein
MRESIFSKYEYPNIKSKIKSYFIKILGLEMGLTWSHICNIKVCEDELYEYRLEILKDEMGRREILILRCSKYV